MPHKAIALIRNLFAVLGVVGVLILVLLPRREIARLTRPAVSFDYTKDNVGASRTPSLVTGSIKPENIILFVADGMGFAHLEFARALHDDTKGQFAWDRFAITGWQRPHPYKGFLIDSAASGTALATGVATWNDRVGVDVEGRPVPSLFEMADKENYRTGVVTDSYIWDATPAAFVTHNVNRDHAADILKQLAKSRLEVLFGELKNVGEKEVPEWDSTIELLETRYSMLDAALNDSAETSSTPIAAVFAEDQITDLQSVPNLPSMVEVALARLSSDDRPFLMMVESEEMDTASHHLNIKRIARGLESIEHTLGIILDFARAHPETLVVFTADHETGGLVLVVDPEDNGIIQPRFVTNHHSGIMVPLLAVGPGAENFSGNFSAQEVGLLLQAMIQSE
jgi:alkaline phosphatase